MTDDTCDTSSPVPRPNARAYKAAKQQTASQVSSAPTYRHPGTDHQPARHEHCPRCNHPVIRALTDGFDISCNPAPLDHLHELHATLTGQPTYALAAIAGHYQLLRRDQWRIHADTDPVVLARHRCDGTGRHDRQPVLLTTLRPQEASDAPPF